MYNRSEIMKAAHRFRANEGITMSDALKIAWCEAKIDAIKSSDEYFLLHMVDIWNNEQREEASKYSREIRALGSRIRKCREAYIVPEPFELLPGCISFTYCSAS